MGKLSNESNRLSEANNPVMLETIEVSLTQGYIAIIDRVDADLAELNWHAEIGKYGHVYAARMVTVNGKRKCILMHRVILERATGDLPSSVRCDHEDGNGLNNIRSNLRRSTAIQNGGNSKRSSRNTSGYKGVYYHARKCKWCSQINVNGKQKHIGMFDTPEQAHEAYQKKAIELYGEFARFE